VILIEVFMLAFSGKKANYWCLGIWW